MEMTRNLVTDPSDPKQTRGDDEEPRNRSVKSNTGPWILGGGGQNSTRNPH
jgi:hypothetical protein